MASKTVSPSFKIFDAISVSGTNAVTSSVSNILYRDAVAMQFKWTGNPQGTVDVQGSVDYAPQLTQAGGAPDAPNSGTWTSLSFSTTPTVAGSSSLLINMTQLSFSNIRAVYTNSSGSGTLTGYVVAKSYGT